MPLMLVLSYWTCSAAASEGAFSNYLPGTYGDFAAAIAPPTDLTIRNDLVHYEGDASTSVRGGRIATDVELDFLVNLTTVLYKPSVEILGAQYAFGAVLPFVDAELGAHTSFGFGEMDVSENDGGLADITLIPAALYWNRDSYFMSLTQIIVAPTGHYDDDALVNPGLNHWSLDTTAAATYLDTNNGRELSAILGYIYNTENSSTQYQSGQEIHLDFMFNQYFSETLAVGIHGYYLKQITGDSGDGALLGDFKGEAAGIGPAALWRVQGNNKSVTFIAKWMHEYDAENRLKGDYPSLSVVLSY